MSLLEKPVGALIYKANGEPVVVREQVRRVRTKPRHWTQALANALEAAAATAAANGSTLDEGRQLLWRRAMTRLTRGAKA